MELLLKRDEKGHGKYDLFAKLEVSPEEEARIRKAAPNKTYVWQPDTASGFKEGRSASLKAIGLIFLGGMLLMLINPMTGLLLFWPLAIIAFFPLRKWLANQNREGITIADLLTGRTIRCKSMDELYVKEDAIREHTKNYCNNIERRMQWAASKELT